MCVCVCATYFYICIKLLHSIHILTESSRDLGDSFYGLLRVCLYYTHHSAHTCNLIGGYNDVMWVDMKCVVVSRKYKDGPEVCGVTA